MEVICNFKNSYSFNNYVFIIQSIKSIAQIKKMFELKYTDWIYIDYTVTDQKDIIGIFASKKPSQNYIGKNIVIPTTQTSIKAFSK